MERAITADERIRKAEEIYQRRRQQNYRTNQTRVNVGSARKDYKLLKKLFLQIAVCSLIYITFYIVKNSNYIFSADFLKQAKEVLSYDINIAQTYDNISNWFALLGKENKEIIPVAEEETTEQTDAVVQEETVKIEDIADAAVHEEQTLSVTEAPSSTPEPLTDAEIIKSNYSIIKPLTGTITSRFGNRNPTTPTVPKYHTGIDIAANTGTKFIAAMSGTVVQVSSEGDYGNHIKIQLDDVATLYAHCSKIYVNEGDAISQGQEIGEVGETGNATGPHLHFEIRKSERYVNPDDILDF